MTSVGATAQRSSGGSSFWRGYLPTLLLWNPLIVSMIVLGAHGPEHIGHLLLFSNLLGAGTYSLCYASVRAVVAIDARLARRGQHEPRARGRAWYFGWALASLPVALAIVYRLLSFLPAPWGGPGLGWAADVYRLGLVIGALVTILFFLGRSRAEARETLRSAELRLAQAEKQRLEVQLAALTAKLNPHLLFNALNAIAGLIPTDPAAAEQTVVRLAELYRGILDSMRRETHPLADELRLCEAYLEVERARFGDRLRSSLPDSDPRAEAIEVPVLILQPLVENAVRHGLSSRVSGGRIDVRAAVNGAELELTVEDDGVGLGKSSHVGTGTGVAMCRKRLELRYGLEASLELTPRSPSGTRATIRLPIGAPGGPRSGAGGEASNGSSA